MVGRIHGCNTKLRRESRSQKSRAAEVVSENGGCCGRKTLHLVDEVGKGVHAHLIRKGLLLHMYCKCGALEDARATFFNMRHKNVVAWTILIRAHSQHGLGNEALHLFQQMGLSGVKPDKVTYITLLDTCARLGAVDEGKHIHALIVRSGLESDVVVGTCLVNMYGKCGSVNNARVIFDKIPQKDAVCWSAMIAAYVWNKQCREALKLFEQMQLIGIAPNRPIYLSILDACGSLDDLAEGRRIHGLIIDSQCETDMLVGTALLHMYSRCGSLKDARWVFERMPQRSVVTWNSMIAAYARHRQGTYAIAILQKMEQEGVIPNNVTCVSILDACASLSDLATGRKMHAHVVESGLELDVIVATALVNMYNKCGSLEGARRMFDKMPERNLVSWNVMIAAYAQHRQCQEAFKLFQEMQLKGMTPDRATFVSIIDACTGEAAFAEGKLMHAHVISSGLESDVIVGTALINMHGKCGSLEDACRTFNKMPERNVISWSAMIAVYAQHGKGKQALRLFEMLQQEGMTPDMITFASILDACASETNLAMGRQMHALVVNSGFVSNVVVGTALVNMYANCGSLEDAWRVFEKIPYRDVISWTAMIAAYAKHGQGKVALEVFQQMLLEGVIPGNSTFSNVLSACSHSGLVDEGCYYFVSMIKDHFVLPTIEHYSCMIDLLGRIGWLVEVEDLIVNMPFQPAAILWRALLGACRVHSDVERGRRAAEYVSDIYPENVASRVVLSNVYAAAGRWDDVKKLRKTMEDLGYCV